MNRLKECRKNARLSQKEVASCLGVAAPTISMWEVGTKNPSAKNVAKLADLYGVTTDYLMGRDAVFTGGLNLQLFDAKQKDPSAMNDREIQDELVKRIMQLDEAGRQRVKDFLAGMGAGV